MTAFVFRGKKDYRQKGFCQMVSIRTAFAVITTSGAVILSIGCGEVTPSNEPAAESKPPTEQAVSQPEKPTPPEVEYIRAGTERTGIGGNDLLLRIKITNPQIPTDEQVMNVITEVFTSTPKHQYWKGMMTVFVYIDDMPTDSVYYATADGRDGKAESAKIDKSNYEMWKSIRNL